MEKEELQKLVNESNSFNDILRKQGKSISGAALKILKSTLEAYDIDTHLLYERKPRKFNETIPLEQMLVKNSYCDKKTLKKRLIEAGLKSNRCENPNCGILEWNGKPLVMQLHHINGDNTDNRLENLQMLCPNCHSQTENHSGRNKRKEQNYCKKCGKPIGNKSTYCTKCVPKHSKEKVINKPSKEELWELIKINSFVKIGEMYGVSDRAVSKWCIKYGLPSTRKEIKEKLNNGGFV